MHNIITAKNTKQNKSSSQTGNHIREEKDGGWIKDTFNFNNIGLKIKTFAQWFCWIGIVLNWVGCGIMFLVCCFNDNLRDLWWVWPISALVTPFILWIGSWSTYAIGNFIENDDKRTESQANIAQALRDKGIGN